MMLCFFVVVLVKVQIKFLCFKNTHKQDYPIERCTLGDHPIRFIAVEVFVLVWLVPGNVKSTSSAGS